MAKPYAKRLLLGMPLHAAAVASLLAGLLLTLVLFNTVHTLERTRSMFDFTRAHQTRVTVVKNSFEAAGEALRAIDLLFKSAEHISEEQFTRFTRPLLGSFPTCKR